MFTQTAIAAAVTAMGMNIDPTKNLSAISSVVEQYAAGAKRGSTDIVSVMKMINSMKEVMRPIDDDTAEIYGYVNEVLAPDFVLSETGAKSVAASMVSLADRTQSSIQSLDSIRRIIYHMDVFAPHQKMVDAAILEEIDRFGRFRGAVMEMVKVCERHAHAVQTSGDKLAEIQKIKFRSALSRVSAANKETLKALADK